MSSSPLQNPEPRKWRFTWETLAHIPTLRLFLFNPDHRPSIQCRNLKSSLNFELSLLSVSWIEDESIDLSVEFELRVPIPRVLIDPGSPVDARALEDHIEVKLVLLLPVDHPLVTADFESVLDASEEGVGGGNGGSNRLMPLSLDSDIRSLSSEGGVHLYCKNCSTKLTRIPLRSFLEIPSVDWREVADNWFGACCCSFGGISEKLVAEYVNSHICANGTCLLDDTSVIICKDDLEGYSFSDHLDNDLKHELKLDLVGKDDSTDCIDSRTNGGGGLSTACGNDGTDDICGTLSSLSLGEKAFHKSHSISECAGKLSQGTGYCFTENTDVAHSIIDEKCSTNMDFLEQELEPTSVRLEKQYSASDLMKNQSHCCVNETHYRSSPLHERSFHNVSIPSTKEEQLTKYAKLQTNQKWLPNGAAGGGFMITSADISNDVEWVRFLCSNCSSLLGSFPSAKDRYTPVDGGVRLFKCYISTTVPVGGSADTFRNHTLQRVFVNRLLESAAEELSFRTIVKDLKDKSPMLQIIILNPKSWCSTGCCLDAENGAEPIPKITLHPVVKVLFSDCSIATKAGMREIEEWANRKQAAEAGERERERERVVGVKMGDRFFPNEFPDFVAETEEITQTATATDALSKLLSLPYHKTAESFLRRAIDLKDKIVKETWLRTGGRVKDFTLYTGSLGTAYLLFKAYQVTNNKSDLNLCIEIVRACEYASRESGHVTYICGRAGVCALGAVAAKQAGDQALLNQYLTQFKKIQLPEGNPNELLYGRSGYLWACFLLNKYIGERTIPSSHTGVISKRIIKDGIQLSDGRCPLMYEWHGKKYWGAAHGLAGIMHVLMEMELKPDEQELVKGTLRYMIHNRFPSGNYPSSEDSETDRLVHWCHGAPGIALTLAKAAKVFQDEEFLKAAGDAQEVVWNRGLLKRVGICHGVSGNTYVFLSLYQLTGNIEFLYRAKAFACFLLDRADNLTREGKMHGGDRPYSLFEGSGGMAFLFFDMINPNEARFPGYEL